MTNPPAAGSDRRRARIATPAIAVVLLVALGAFLGPASALRDRLFGAEEAQSGCLGTTPPDGLDLSSNQRTMVYRLYCGVFLRTPDVEGFDYWVDEVSQGLSARVVADHFVVAPEFAERYGELNDARYIEVAYQTLLGRAVTVEEAEYWTALMADPVFSRAEVMVHLTESDEFKVRTGTLQPIPVHVAGAEQLPDGELYENWLVPGMTARQAANAELATGTYDDALCSGYGGRVEWVSIPDGDDRVFAMSWCVNMDHDGFAPAVVDGVFIHEAMHARIGVLYHNRDLLSPSQAAEVERVAITEAETSGEGLADFWAMRYEPQYVGSDLYAPYVYNDTVWDEIFGRYPIGGPPPR